MPISTSVTQEYQQRKSLESVAPYSLLYIYILVSNLVFVSTTILYSIFHPVRCYFSPSVQKINYSKLGVNYFPSFEPFLHARLSPLSFKKWVTLIADLYFILVFLYFSFKKMCKAKIWSNVQFTLLIYF